MNRFGVASRWDSLECEKNGFSSHEIILCGQERDSRPSSFAAENANSSSRTNVIASHLSHLTAWGSLLVSGALEGVKSVYDYSSSDQDNSQSEVTASVAGIQKKQLRAWEISAVKQAVLMSLRSHPSLPLSYEEDENSTVVEFCYHPSHLVCVIDDAGIQFLWTKDAVPHSEYVPDKAISISGLSQKVALLMG